MTTFVEVVIMMCYAINQMNDSGSDNGVDVIMRLMVIEIVAQVEILDLRY